MPFIARRRAPLPLSLLLLTGCSGAVSGPVSIADYPVEPKDPAAVAACDLVPAEHLAGIGFSVEGRERSFGEDTQSCTWTESTRLNLQLRSFEVEAPNGVEHVLANEALADAGMDVEFFDIEGYPASWEVLGSTTCAVNMAASDRHYLTAQVEAAQDSCGTAAEVLAASLETMPPVDGTAR